MDLDEFNALTKDEQIAVIIEEKKTLLAEKAVVDFGSLKAARLARFDANTAVKLENLRVNRYKARLVLIETMNTGTIPVDVPPEVPT